MAKVLAYLKTQHLAMAALFFALGGTSYAAADALAPKNSVGTNQVINGSLKVVDFNKKQLANLRGPRGATGPQGQPGPQGQAGGQGPPGVVGNVTIKRLDFALNDGTAAAGQVLCPAGTKAIGGGTSVEASSASDIHVLVSRPYSSPGADPPADNGTFNGWRVAYRNNAGAVAPASGNTTARVFVVCAQA